MNFPISQSDFLVTMSDFAELLTLIKVNMENLEHNMQHHIDNYLKQVIDIDSSKEELDITASNIHPHISDKQLELWMYDLKNQLIHLEFCGRAAALRIFLYLSNYLHILRTPIKKSCDYTYKLPVYNIEFPRNKKNEYRVLLKDLPKLKRKKNVTKVSTCGGNDNYK